MLSPYGIRSLSKRHAGEPFSVVDVEGETFSVDYEPAESRSALYGGNSAGAGRLVPHHYLVIEGLQRYDEYLGEGFTGRVPDRVRQVAHAGRGGRGAPLTLVALFVPGPDGRRPADRRSGRSADPALERRPLFYEYFDGDDGAGLGASHQTGWTGLVADLIRRMPAAPDRGTTDRMKPRRGTASEARASHLA